MKRERIKCPFSEFHLRELSRFPRFIITITIFSNLIGALTALLCRVEIGYLKSDSYISQSY